MIPDILQDALLVLVIAAAAADLRWRRIPNWIVVSGLSVGVACNAFYGSWQGLAGAVMGAVLGAALFAGIYIAGGMGAGDVKLFAAIGAMVGPEPLLIIFVLTGIIGGVAALLVLLVKGRVVDGLSRTAGLTARWMRFDWPGIARASGRSGAKAVSLPYGAVVASGTVLFLIALRHQAG